MRGDKPPPWENGKRMGWFRHRRKNKLLVLLLAPLLAVSAGCRPAPWGLWQSYSARFIDGQGREIEPRVSDHTTSEGEAYAMFFALVDNDQATFDRLLNWSRNNLARGDLRQHLPGWEWGKDKNGQWTVLDTNSAADADVWMACSLLEAGRLWNQASYRNQGLAMMDQIAHHEVADLPGFGMMLLPGAEGYVHQRSATLKTWIINPSYLPLFLFERMAEADPSGPWQKIALNIPRLLQLSAVHGYAMDWVEYVPGDGFYPINPHPAQDGKTLESAVGSYDAIRVYLWAGLLNANNRRRSDVLGAVPGMRVWLAEHDVPPEKISDTGIPMMQEGPVGYTAALLPYLRAWSHQEKVVMRQMIRLSVQKNSETGLYGNDQAYYDQNLALFASGFLEGRFRFGQHGELKVDWINA